MSNQIFNNRKITRLLERYVRRKNDLELRNRIMSLTLPLIGAALSKMHMIKNREDIQQECALKVLYALPKYKKERGDAFGFLWTVICNSCRTNAERYGRPSLSLSSDDVIQHEAENTADEAFQTPENQHVLNAISKDLIRALNNGRFHVRRSRGHTRACREISKAVSNGDLFFDRETVLRKLRGIGLSKKDVQYYVEFSLVNVRMRLLAAKENSLAISHTKISKSVPSVSYSGDS